MANSLKSDASPSSQEEEDLLSRSTKKIKSDAGEIEGEVFLEASQSVGNQEVEIVLETTEENNILRDGLENLCSYKRILVSEKVRASSGKGNTAWLWRRVRKSQVRRRMT